MNTQYTSAEIQNEIISICRSILEKICEEVKESGIYSIIGDECTDSGNKKQLPLSVRYVSNEETREPLLGFFKLDSGVTGEAIAHTIESAVLKSHLDPT